VTIYTRAGCHLCEEAERVLHLARRQTSFELEVVDVDRDDALRALYGEEIPVIASNGVKAFKYRVSEREFLKRLAART
jgi:glutaredoxin